MSDWLKANLWLPDRLYDGFRVFEVDEKAAQEMDFNAIAHLPISARRDIVERFFGFGPFAANNMTISYSQCQHCNERLRHYMPVCWSCGSLRPVDVRNFCFSFYFHMVAIFAVYAAMLLPLTDYYKVALIHFLH
jgi:hypothetical protein